MIKTKTRFRLLLFTVLLLLAIATTGGILAYRSMHNRPNKTSGSFTHYSPPTKEEAEAGDQKKQEIVNKTATTPPQPPSTANVVIVDAGQYDNNIEARAFVSNVISAGTCSFSFTDGSSLITRDTPAFKDATTTQCTPLKVSDTLFHSGDWKVTVKYSGTNISGEETKLFTVK